MDTVRSPQSVRPAKVAIIGNPNTGKSTLFNVLTGMHSRVGNFPGVTVEKKVGRVSWDGRAIDLIDLPGTYSLSPRSLDEMVSVNVLLGRQPDVGELHAVVCIVDASNLERNLYLVSQVLDLGLPTVVVLNMWDVAVSRETSIDVAQLENKLGVPVVVTEAHRKRGLGAVQHAVARAVGGVPAANPKPFPDEFYAACATLRQRLDEYGEPATPDYLVERLILDVGGHVESYFAHRHADGLPEFLKGLRERLAASGCRIPAVEAKARYAWVRRLLSDVVTRPQTRPVTVSDKIDRVLTHRLSGLGIFGVLMFIVFQAIYTWAGPSMDLFEAGQNWLASGVVSVMPPGPFRSLLTDGLIAGVGAVLIFLPQIVILFFFIALLEDCGYMARAAFLMDKLMTRIGLSGKSFVPLMSSFACAIPGVMATRVIENRRDRMVTILIAPLMSCSARLPVYLLLIAAFVPPTAYWGGWVTLPGLVLLAMTSIGAVVAIPVAWLLKKLYFQGETPPFVMELPSYKWPSPRIVLSRVYDRARAFVTRAGTLILSTAVVVWAAGSFPGDRHSLYQLEARIEAIESLDQTSVPSAPSAAEETTQDHSQPDSPPTLSIDEQLADLTDQQNRLRAELMSQSVLGRVGRIIEPVVRPLGWDWKIGVGAVASFPAREVIIATLGTIYSLGGDVAEEDQRLKSAMQAATWPDGRKVYSMPVALSIMVFFALCAQCASTLMVIRRETNSWFWPAFTFAYMTILAYVAALLTYQIGSRIP